MHNWVICRVCCSQTLKLTVRSIVHKQLNLYCFGKASFEISKRLLRYYRTERQRAVLPPLPLLVKGQGGSCPPVPAPLGTVLTWGAHFLFGAAQATRWGSTAPLCPPMAPGLIVLFSSREQGNFQGLEASRPRPRTSKCVLEDVLGTKDVLEDCTSDSQVWHVLFFSNISLPVILKYDMPSWSTS